MRKYFILFVIVPILSFNAAAQQTSLQTTPLPCTTTGRDPSQPWVHNAKVLDSFPKDNPLPRFVGAYRDKNWNYQLILFQDLKGIFGELLSPVLDADSPTSRLYDAAFDSQSGALRFGAKFRDGQLQFSGVLRGRTVEANITRNNRNEKAVLKRIKWYDDDEEVAYTSRAQFDCAMLLYGRY